jgi:acyl transferase domain-containing protein
VGGVIKMVMAMQHGVLPKTLHVDEPTPHVDWSAGAVELLTEARPWPQFDRPRRAGVSSFGISGTNAHVIIEQAPETEAASGVDGDSPAAFVPWFVSARSEAGLRAQARGLLAGIDGDERVGSPLDVAYSLAATRSALDVRAVVTGAERADLVRGLRSLAEGVSDPGVEIDTARPDARLVFLFTGQGSQRVGMGRELSAAFPVFASAFDEVLARFEGLRDVVFGVAGTDGLLDQTVHTQAGLFAFEVASFRLLESFGVRPDFLLGHSIGELAAAHVAGVWSLEDAARVVIARGRLMQELPVGGAMVAIGATEADVLAALQDISGVEIAAINSPSSVVVTGDEAPVLELAARFEAEGRKTRRLTVSHAFHSARMEPMLDEFRAVLDSVSFNAPRIPIVSNLTGSEVSAQTLGSPEYWTRQVRETVRFADGVEWLRKSQGASRFLEVGPDGVLSAMVRETLGSGPETLVVPLVRRDRPEAETALRAAARLHVAGARVDWPGILQKFGGRRVELPNFAFQRTHFWLGGAAQTGRPAAAPDEDGGRYSVHWKHVPDAPSGQLSGTWLVVSPPGVEADEECISVLYASGAQCERLILAAHELDRESIAARLNDIPELTGVVSLLGLTTDAHPDAPLVTAGLAGTLALVQALADVADGRGGPPARLWSVTRGAVSTGADDPAADVAGSQIWGFGRSAALEQPTLWGGLIDLPAASQDGADTWTRVGSLIADGSEDQVAVRPSVGVLARRLRRAGNVVAAGAGPTGWEPRGTVLITGGTGGLGAHVARWAAGHGAEHLVLAGRRGSDTPGVADLEADLVELGVRVTIAACDVSDRDSLARLVEQVEAVEGESPIRAVVHTAGVAQDCAILDTDLALCTQILAGKAAGAANLDAVFADRDLDAFVLFSSVAGVWGGGVQGVYAAANAFVDAVAEHRRLVRGRNATSIAWGPWADAGMVGDERDVDRLARRGLRAIERDHGLRFLAAAVGSDDCLVAVADVDWKRFAAGFTALRPSPLLADLAGSAAATTSGEPDTDLPEAELARRLASAEEPERIGIALETVRSEVARVLGHATMDAVPADRAFRDLGFDSLTAVELRGRLAQLAGIPLATTVVFDYPNPAALAAYLCAELAGELTAEFGGAHSGRNTPGADEPIAIIAMACRYPGGVASPEDLWRLVAEGGDAIGGFPTDRGWDLDGLYDPDPDHPGTSYTRHGGFLDRAAEFDARFFGISPREALAMDPQQRLLLETTWELFERAGLDPASLRGTASGVFIGGAPSGYGAGAQSGSDGAEGYGLTGSVASVLSGRLAYTFGLEGPAITVDTACSSSLVALHLAIQSLRRGECGTALVGGVAVMAIPTGFVEFSRQRGLSVDGRCKSFASAADGTGWSEGSGVLLLERLSDARRNGRRILAVIRGSAINQDGASNGLSAPNGPSQQRVIRQALADAGLTTHQVDAVEAHGTGTTLGDPIEAQALLATYGRGRDADRPLRLGSVKSNIGHSAAAAGVAGVIKTVMSIRSGLLPKTLHVDAPTGHVDWASGGVELLTEAIAWPETGRPRRAGVSSFGISGTNAHVIIEQAPEPETVPSEDVVETGRSLPFAISAASADALRDQALRLRDQLNQPNQQAADIAYSLATTRTAMEHRAVVVARERDGLLRGLGALAAGEPSPDVVEGVVSRPRERTVFVFPGQGSQWAGMAADLLDSSPEFARSMAACEAALAPHVDWSLTEILRSASSDPLERVNIVQPALWAVMVALADVWRAHGLRPAAVIGHSQGEIAAACVAGVLSLEDGAKIVALRSRLLLKLSGRGAMASVGLALDEVAKRIEPYGERIAIAAANGPGQIVVSGDPDAVAELVEGCVRDGVRARLLPVDYASHSSSVELIRDELIAALAGIEAREGDVPFHSTVTGALLEAGDLDAEYWYTNLRRTVRFEQTVESLMEQGFEAFVEVSPHPTLTTSIEQIAERRGRTVAAIGTLRRDHGNDERLQLSLAQAFTSGLGVRLAATFDGMRCRTVDLPTYPFQRGRFWLDSSPASAEVSPVTGGDADPLQEQFWDLVEAENLGSLCELLEVRGDQTLDAVLPALGSWRRRRKDERLIDGWRYGAVWQGWTTSTATAATGVVWLALIPKDLEDDATLSAILAALKADGAETIVPMLVEPGSVGRIALSRLLDTSWPASAENVRVLSFFGMSGARCSEPAGLSVALAGTVALVQALADREAQTRLWCVTRGAVAVTAEASAPLNAEASQIWGLGRVAALEHPDLWGGLIDLPPSSVEETEDGNIGALLTCLGETEHEDQFAIRDSAVHTRRMIRTPLPDTGPARDWRPKESVLITGGTGVLQAYVARWLAGQGAEHVVLAGRVDEPADALVAELAALGARSSVIECDLSDPRSVVGFVDGLRVDGVTVSTVVHAADEGVGLAPLVQSDPEAFARAIRAKADAAALLDRLLDDDQGSLETTVYFSSVAAFWGSGDHAVSAAANAHLDALAQRRRARGRHALSVAWPVLDLRGPEDSADPEAARVVRHIELGGLGLLDPALAMAALQQALDHDDTCVTIADVEWRTFSRAFTARRPSPLLNSIPEARQALAAIEQDEQADTAAAAELVDRLAELPGAERTRRLLDLVRAQTAAVLGHESAEQIEPDRAFSEMGFESITAVELRNRLNRLTGLHLPATVLFDHPNPRALAEVLRSELFADTVADAAFVHAELDRLADGLAAADVGPSDRAGIAKRLQGLLARWNTADPVTATGAAPAPSASSPEGADAAGQFVAERLDAASDEEMLEFINSQLGKRGPGGTPTTITRAPEATTHGH